MFYLPDNSKKATPLWLGFYPALLRFLAFSLWFGVICLSLWLSLREALLNGGKIDDSAIHVVDLLGDRPIEITPEPVRADVAISADKLAHYAHLIASVPSNEPERVTRARMLHIAKLWKFDPSLPEWIERDQMGIYNRVLIGGPAFSESWRGLEIAETADGRATEHRDQMLSTLAESRVPLDAAINVGTRKHSVRDLLRTSIDEFHLKQPELEWTATAYAFYIPPQSHWWNRYGEKYSFDELAEELMRRSLNGGSCQGIHLATSLTTILLCDEQVRFLSANARDRICSRLRGLVKEAVAWQRPDGLWPVRWAPKSYFNDRGQFTPPWSISTRVLVSGHLLEWFHWLPKNLKPPEVTIRSGLVALVKQIDASPPAIVGRDFCPYTHALVALFLASSQ